MYNDPNHLPEKHRYDHEFCLFLHDICVSILEKCLQNGEVQLDLTEEQKQTLNKYGSDRVIDWMIENGYKEKANLILKRSVFNSLLMDFLHYILESLKTSELGKISVSYTLLRKPLKDNLFYLEWLFYDSDELLSYVDNGKIHLYEVGNMRRQNNQKMKSIIDNAYNENFFKDYIKLTENDFLYKVRYDYRAPYGLELIWNKSIHLVTTVPSIRSKDFNDIFLNKDDYLKRWDFYYSKTPLLLLYATGIIINLYEKFFNKISDVERYLNNELILARWITRTNDFVGKEILNSLLDVGNVSIECDDCGILNDVHSDHLHILQYDYFFLCDECNGPIPLSRFHFQANK